MSLSVITISGTITKDAEQRFTPNNTPVITLMLHVLRYNSKNKEEKSYPVKVNLWGDSYTDQLNTLKQGTRVIVTGRLQLDQYTDKSGKSVRLAVVEANNIHLLDDLRNTSSTFSKNEMTEFEGSQALVEEEVPF